MNSFGENLKKIRKSKGISQKKLASDLDISQGTIANYEKDNRFPKEKIMLMIADYFEVSVDYLIGRVDTIEKLASEEEQDLKAIKFIDFSIIDESFYTFASNYYYDLIIKNDLESAYLLVYKVYVNGGKLVDIYNYIFVNSLIKIGDMWQAGKLDIATEHHFSALSENVMTRLHHKVEKKIISDKKVLCMCVKDEKHVIGCKMISHFVDYMGMKSFYVGDNVPYKSIESYSYKNNIDLLVISITMAQNEENLDELLDFISESKNLKNVKILLGGSFFKSHGHLEKYKNYTILSNIEETIELLGRYKAEEVRL